MSGGTGAKSAVEGGFERGFPRRPQVRHRLARQCFPRLLGVTALADGGVQLGNEVLAIVVQQTQFRKFAVIR